MEDSVKYTGCYNTVQKLLWWGGVGCHSCLMGDPLPRLRRWGKFFWTKWRLSQDRSWVFCHKIKYAHVPGRWREVWKAKAKKKNQWSLSLYQGFFYKSSYSISMTRTMPQVTLCRRSWDIWVLAWYIPPQPKLGLSREVGKKSDIV